MRWGAVALAALAACYEPPVGGTCAIRCVEGSPNACPDGQSCAAGFCVLPGGTCTTELASISVGGRHACGLDPTGHAVCWGDNHEGQLGDPSVTDEATAPHFIGPQTWTEIAAGNEHTCAISATDGTVWCWGQNADGEAKGPKGGTVTMPTQVATPSNVPAAFDHVYGGGAHSCALGQGQAWCWGSQSSLVVGASPTMMERFAPSVDDFTELAAGTDHTCGISPTMGVWCWGHNDQGQSGQTPGASVMPTAADIGLPPTRVPIHISSGDSASCVILGDAADSTQGDLWCWGYNIGHDIQTGAAGDVPMAAQITANLDWTSVTVGWESICGVRAGHGYCWGASMFGNNGDGVWGDEREFAQPADVGPADQVSLGKQTPANTDGVDEVGCLRSGTAVSCWGTNSYGELGIGSSTLHPTPTAVASPNGQPWVHVWSSNDHSCGQTADGALWCWGADTAGAITATTGHGTMSQPCTPGACDAPSPTPAPTQIVHPDDVVIGEAYTCALQSGAIICWGDFTNGVLGVNRPTPGVNTVGPPAQQQWTQIFGGDTASCGLTSAGEMLCWGLVVGVKQTSPVSASDMVLANMVSLEFGDTFACGARLDSARICWGDNSNGELADGTLINNAATPTVYPGNITAVAARGAHSCAIGTDQSIQCWGNNGEGECGVVNTTQYVDTLNVVSGDGSALAGCTSVAAGEQFACAVCADQPWCWGLNNARQLGRGDVVPLAQDSMADRVQVPPGGTYTQVSTGDFFACAVDAAGELYCWGFGAHGELGDGSHAANLPTLISTAQ